MKILAQWQSYEREVVPTTAPIVQREECRRAFYAGAAALFYLVMDITKFDDDAVCEQKLAALQAELEQFPYDLRVK